MNKTETWVVDNPARRALQRWYEAPTLRRLGGTLPAGSRVVEVGCGAGYGTSLILDYFGARHVDAVDLDQQMVAKARRRLRHHGNRVRLTVGDATDLRAVFGAGEAAYDAAFDFAIVHHIEDWRAALAEIARVLRPGGIFYFDEVTAHALARPRYRALFDHPEPDRFTAEQFLDAPPRHADRRLDHPNPRGLPARRRPAQLSSSVSQCAGKAARSKGKAQMTQTQMTPTNAAHVVTVAGLRKSFGSTRALDGLDLAVGAGDVHGFLGPNGAGKTTMIRILLGLMRADDGRARLGGRDPWRNATQLHRRIAYVPGDLGLWPSLTGGEVIDLLGRMRGGLDARRRDELIERFDLDPRKKGRAYSKGNRQKVPLVAAMASDAELLLLDEPTSGLDPLMEETFRQVIAEDRDADRRDG